MNIRLAKRADAPHIDALLQSCKEHMERNGLFQWTAAYPNSSITLEDIAKEHLYVIEDKRVLGIVVFNEEQEIEYKEVNWLHKDAQVLVIHRLAVRPDCQGKGYARRLMDFAEEFAVNNGYSSIRLDAYSENNRALKMYKRREYQTRGTVNFQGRSAPFFCFEKHLAILD